MNVNSSTNIRSEIEYEYLFDLNTTPLHDESGDERHNNTHPRDEIGEHRLEIRSEAEMREEDLSDIQPLISSSPNRAFSIDLNLISNDYDEFEATSMEFDTHQLHDEVEVQEDFEAPNPDISHETPRVTRTNLSNGQRWAIYNALLEKSVNGKLKRDTTNEVAALFSVSLRTVQRIWKRANDTPLGEFADVSHKRTGNCGRKRVEVNLSQISDIPLRQRTTLRSLATSLGVNLATLHRRLKQGHLRRHSNAIKPLLNDENKRARLQYCISMLDPHSIPHEPKFVDMYNVVHIDEKWFYMSKKSETYYLLPNEDEPLRTCRSKNFIGKVMFLAAMGRPRFDNEGHEVFSGKIGVFPFVTTQPAQRRSRNRAAGTLEMKPLISVKRETIRACLIEKVLPAIQAKWHLEEPRRTIFIQQDNARTHIDMNDEEFHRAASQNGFDIRIFCQPPNSPDLNILDLGFFRAIQALQHKECPTTVEGLVHAVQKAFQEYPVEKIDHVFLSLQLCMREIMKARGSKQYKIPHISKARLERNGCLPKQIACDHSLVEGVMNMLAG